MNLSSGPFVRQGEAPQKHTERFFGRFQGSTSLVIEKEFEEVVKTRN
jgi:hypothetical protein